MTHNHDILYQGSTASKFFGAVSFIFLVLGIGVFFAGHWLLSIACVATSIGTGFVSYKLSGARENPQLYAKLDLFGVVAYGVQSANARIGFHSPRSQDEIVRRLEAVGFPLSSRDVRQEIRRLIVKYRRAFDACRDLMVIQAVHGGRQLFWDGFGNSKPVEWFYEAQIIIDIQSTTQALINRLLELVGDES